MSPSLRRQRDLILAAVLCGLVGLLSLALFRQVQRPWEGPTGRAIYGEASARDSVGEKWLGGFRILLQGGEGAAKPMETEDWVVVGVWAGTLVFAIIFLSLAATAPLWVRMGRRPPGMAPVEAPTGWRATRWSVCALLAALALAGAIRWPWLDHQILWDEQDNLRRNYHGYHAWTAADQSPVWQEASFKDSFWENRRGNNPHLYSSLAWLSNDLWRKLTGAPREQYNLVATRLPAAVFGWLAIVSLWWCLNAVGLPRAAPVAALLAAVHPLWSQYAIEARGYALTLFLSPLVMGFARRFLKTGRCRDMAGLGLGSMCSLMAYPGSLYFVVCIQALVLLKLLFRWRIDRNNTLWQLDRWFIINVMTGAVFLLLMAPIIPQTAAVMENSFQRGSMPAYWFIMAHHLYATGLQFHFTPEVFFHTDPAAPGALAWTFGDFFRMTPVAIWSLVVFPFAVGAGLWSWWRSGHGTWLGIAAATLLAGLLCPAHNALVTGCFIYPWYMIFTLPLFLAAFASGVEWLAARVLPRTRSEGKALAMGMLAAFCWLWISHPVFRPDGWRSLHAHTFARPGFAAWPKDERVIAQTRFTRGRGLWVNYADGYQVYVPKRDEDPETWDRALERPASSFNRFPPPQP